jgi:hypothetical protein
VHERKSPDDDMGRDSRFEKREDIRDEDIVFFRCYNLAQTGMEIVVVALRLPFVFLGLFNPREGLGGFCLGDFGLLFRSSFGAPLFTVEIIHAIESHIEKY